MRLVILLLLLGFTHPLSAQEQVVFGERNLHSNEKALFFDRNGFIYPDTLISDSSLQASEASLLKFYQTHPEFCQPYFAKFNLTPSEDKEIYKQLNDSIFKYALLELKKTAKDYASIQINVHGFRKSFHDNGVDVPSTVEYGLLRKDREQFGLQNSLMIDIYWDATYGCCFGLDFKKNDSLFILFEKAMLQAEQVSKPLSSIIDNFSGKRIHLLAHSLGTRVAVSALRQTNNIESDIRVGLIAAAIPRTLITDGYKQQAFKSSLRWMIYYNEKDFALLKKDNVLGIIGPGAYTHGVTTLGCNKENDALKLKKEMLAISPKVSIQLVKMNHIGKCHSLRCYTNGTDLNPIWHFFAEE